MTGVSRRSNSAEKGKRTRSNRSPLEFALIRLARRAHSEGELISKVDRAGYAECEISATLVELRNRRYVDDLAFALGVARAARAHKHWGPVRIAHGLRKRGLADPHIEQAVAEAFPEGEAEPVAEVLDRFRRTDRGRGTPRQRKARAYRHLYARGFSPEAIRHALESPAYKA
jgi:regulatory protein